MKAMITVFFSVVIRRKLHVITAATMEAIKYQRCPCVPNQKMALKNILVLNTPDTMHLENNIGR